MRLITLGLLFLVLVAARCEDDGALKAGDTFAYVGFDQQGARVVEGQLRFDSVESDRVSGRWRLASSRPANEIGPQKGEGSFAGSILGEQGRTTLALDLNPGIADDNVFLSGTLEGTRLTGQWGWSTLVGTVRSGRFEAVRD